MEKIFAVWVHSLDPAYAWLNRKLPQELEDLSVPLARGLPVGDRFPKGVVFDLSPDFGIQLTDSLGNTSLLHVVSDRLKQAIEKTNHPVEFFPVAIRNHKKRIWSDPYYVMNLLGSVDALDRGRSDWSESNLEPGQANLIRRIELDLTRLPDDVQLFRLSVDTSLILVRLDLARQIYRTLNCRGMLFQKLELYGEEIRPL